MNPYITCQKSFNEFISIVGTIDNMYNFKFNFEPFVSIETKIIPIIREDNDIYLLLSRVLLLAVIKNKKYNQIFIWIIWLYFMESIIQKYDSKYINIIKIVFSKIIIFDESKIAKSEK